MALTVVKYRKSLSGETTAITPTVLIKKQTVQQQQTILKKPIIKLEGGGTGLIINKLPASIKPIMKRSATHLTESSVKNSKFALQTIASAGTPLTTFQWQHQVGGSSGTTITTTPTRNQQLIGALSSLPPNTIIQTTGGNNITNLFGASGTTVTPLQQTNGGTTFTLGSNASNMGTSIPKLIQGRTSTIQRPQILVKREVTKRTMRAVTLELVEKNPHTHLGITPSRLQLLKNYICPSAGVNIVDCYITLKKLRQNEQFSLLAEYFEMSEGEVQQIFVRTVCKLARFLRVLIRWPDSKQYYDRHKHLPFVFRSDLNSVQTLIECVDTEMQRTTQFDCNNFKFILSITPNSIITYVSDAYIGHNDDLVIFKASNFQSYKPDYLSLFADPGKAVRRKKKTKNADSKNNNNSTENILNDNNDQCNVETDSTDSADESMIEEVDDEDDDEFVDNRKFNRGSVNRLAAELTSELAVNIVNNELVSTKVPDLKIPTMRAREPMCRLLIRYTVHCMRLFKILQPYAISEPILYQYLNEIIVVVAALTNLNH